MQNSQLHRPVTVAPQPVDTLQQEAREALAATGYGALRTIQIGAHEGLVCLRGRVPSYYTKQLATAALLRLPGVIELCNDLMVEPPNELSQSFKFEGR